MSVLHAVSRFDAACATRQHPLKTQTEPLLALRVVDETYLLLLRTNRRECTHESILASLGCQEKVRVREALRRRIPPRFCCSSIFLAARRRFMRTGSMVCFLMRALTGGSKRFISILLVSIESVLSQVMLSSAPPLPPRPEVAGNQTTAAVRTPLLSHSRTKASLFDYAQTVCLPLLPPLRLLSRVLLASADPHLQQSLP